MLELVFVIVVIGILAAAIIPRMDRDTLYEASEQLLHHIKYTQQLAMSENVYDDVDPNWYQSRWAMRINNNAYSIIRSNDITDTAVDPLTKADIDGTNEYDLNFKYRATVTIPTNTYILAFDHLGRPYDYTNFVAATLAPSTEGLLPTDLNITVTANNQTAIITVTRETGYSYITYQ